MAMKREAYVNVEWACGVNPGAWVWVPFKWWNPWHWRCAKR